MCTLGTLNLYSLRVITALIYQKELCVYKLREWFVQPTYTKVNMLQLICCSYSGLCMYVCMFFTKNLVLDLHRREIIGRVNLYAIIVRSIGKYWISRNKQNIYIVPRCGVPQIRPCRHKYDIKLLF